MESGLPAATNENKAGIGISTNNLSLIKSTGANVGMQYGVNNYFSIDKSDAVLSLSIKLINENASSEYAYDGVLDWPT